MKILQLFLYALAFILLTGCRSDSVNSAEQGYTDINFYSQSESVNLSYKELGSPAYKQVKMEKRNGNWWNARIPRSEAIKFFFTDNEEKVYNLGGTMGAYPGDPSEDFETSAGKVWVKNGLLFNYNPDLPKPSGELVVLTLNMHTYQEEDQSRKFEAVAEAISQLNPDIVALQECAQRRDSKIVGSHNGVNIREDNMALIITNLLRSKYNDNYNFYWDWSHYGFDTYEEGTAILSKYELAKMQSHYISLNHSKDFWKSRNVTMVQTDAPGIGKINVFSAHMGWWDDKEEPFKEMFDKLNDWVLSESKSADISFICGDFNIEAGSEGYKYPMSNSKYTDAYYSANSGGFFDPTIGGRIDGWKNGDAEGKRIDYMFLLKGTDLKVDLAQRIFTEKSFGRVSDHCGVYFYLSK